MLLLLLLLLFKQQSPKLFFVHSFFIISHDSDLDLFPILIRYILEYLEGGGVKEIPKDERRRKELMEEADFFNIQTLKHALQYRIFGSRGSSDCEFDCPYDVAVDGGTGRIFVVDQYNDPIQVFNGEGNFLFKFGSLGSNDGEFEIHLELQLMRGAIMCLFRITTIIAFKYSEAEMEDL